MKFSADSSADETSIIIDMTSLIDVLFVLLLFFVVTTTFSDSGNIPIKLPSSSSTVTQTAKKDVAVTLTETGEIFMNDKQLSLDELSAALQQTKTAETDVTVVVRADKKVEHGTVVSVLDRAKLAGVDRIAIATTSDTTH